MRVTPACLLALALLAGGCTTTREKPAAALPKPPNGVPLLFPINGGGLPLPTQPTLMPGAKRNYRGGVHEGIDIFFRANGDGLACGEPVLNAADGWVIRVDYSWKQVLQNEYDTITRSLQKVHDETMLDRLRGRQVWVKLADGTVLRYCHLNTVTENLAIGARVSPGTVLGTMGNSGTADGARGTGKNCHLHFEIWPAGGGFLGEGLSPAEIRALWESFFGITQQEK